MKKKRWGIVRILINILLAACLFLLSWFGLTPSFRLERKADGDHFRNLPAHTIDALAVGSSHMQYAFNPGTFYAYTGKYAYVYGSVCQPFDASYWVIKEAFEHQSPSVVYLDIYTLLPQSQNCYADEVYYVAGDLLSGRNRDAMLAEAVGLDTKTRWMYRFDLYMNHDYWKEMDFRALAENRHPFSGYDESLGYVRQEPTDFRYTSLPILPVQEQVALTEREKREIDRIIDLCQKKRVHLVFTCAPYLMDQASTDKKEAVWAYLEARNIPYLDEVKASNEHWFLNMHGDTAHNNSWGAEIVTCDYARFALENDYFGPHREDETLNLLVRGVEEANAVSLLSWNNINVYTLLEAAAHYPCRLAIRFCGNRRRGLDTYEAQILQVAGVSVDLHENYQNDYYALIQNGRIVQENGEPFLIVFDGHTYQFTETDILIDDESIAEPGEMQLVFMPEDGRWFNPIGIDYASRWFWKNGCDGWQCE